MNENTTPAERETNRELVPSDFLIEWIRRGTLLNLILDAAQTLEWPETELKLAASSGYAFRRLALLTVVTYCHATGVYGSKDIALKISREEILRFLCAGTSPTWQEIQDFSRRHPDLIKQSLIQTCKLAHKYGLRTLRTAADAPAIFGQDTLKGLNDPVSVELEPQSNRAAETRIGQAGDLAAAALER